MGLRALIWPEVAEGAAPLRRPRRGHACPCAGRAEQAVDPGPGFLWPHRPRPARPPLPPRPCAGLTTKSVRKSRAGPRPADRITPTARAQGRTTPQATPLRQDHAPQTGPRPQPGPRTGPRLKPRLAEGPRPQPGPRARPRLKATPHTWPRPQTATPLCALRLGQVPIESEVSGGEDGG